MNLFQNIKTFFTILYIFFTNFTYIIHPQLMEYDKLMEPIKLCYIIDNINIIDEDEDYQNIENEDEYRFNGIIACSRMIKNNKKKKLILFIGVKKNKYIEVNINDINVKWNPNVCTTQ